MDLYRISPKGIELIWRQVVSTWQERSVGRRPPPAEVLNWIRLREIQLWLALPDPEYLSRDWRNQPYGILLAWAYRNSKNEYRLMVQYIAGRKLTTWAEAMAQKLEAWRTHCRLEGIDFYANPRNAHFMKKAFGGSPVAFHREEELPPVILARRSA